MTVPGTGKYHHQRGVLRIEITAIVMLMAALAIVLATNLPTGPQASLAQAVKPVRAMPVVSGGTAALTTTLVLPVAGSEPFPR